MRTTCDVLRDMTLLGAKDGHTLALCAMPFHWPCRAKQQLATWGRREGYEEEGEQSNENKEMARAENHETKKETEKAGRLWMGGVFPPVHQRFYFLFIHTVVVDPGLLRLLLLLLIFVVFKWVRAHWCCFIWHSQANNMGHSERWVVVMHAHIQ